MGKEGEARAAVAPPRLRSHGVLVLALPVEDGEERVPFACSGLGLLVFFLLTKRGMAIWKERFQRRVCRVYTV
jgi:hypothetical protein